MSPYPCPSSLPRRGGRDSPQLARSTKSSLSVLSVNTEMTGFSSSTKIGRSALQCPNNTVPFSKRPSSKKPIRDEEGEDRLAATTVYDPTIQSMPSHKMHEKKGKKQKLTSCRTILPPLPTICRGASSPVKKEGEAVWSLKSFQVPDRVYVIKESLVPNDYCKSQVHLLLAMMVDEPPTTPSRRKAIACRRTSGSSCPLIVIKVISKAWLRLFTEPDSPIGELQALQILSHSKEHPHVVPLIEAMEDQDYLYLITPYVDGGELFYKVEANEAGLPEEEARYYFKQIVEGMLHLKRHGLAHGDVSLENVMLSSNNSSSTADDDCLPTCRLIDLEMARIIAPNPSTMETAFTTTPAAAGEDVHNDDNEEEEGEEGAMRRRRRRLAGGKPAYVSPEVVNGTVKDWHASDIWSLSIALFLMLTGRPLYSDPDCPAFDLLSIGGAYGLIGHYSAAFGMSLPPLAADLICSMLRSNPTKRPTLEEVAQHPWLREAGDDEKEEEQKV